MAVAARSFSFGGCGWMMSYHLGAMRGLQQRGVLDFARGSQVAAASGGSLVGACFAAGLSAEELEEAIVAINASSHAGGLRSWLHKLDRVIGDTLDGLLPHNAHELVEGKLIIPTRVVAPYSVRGSQFHSSFTSKDDLIQACIASAFVPYYSMWGSGYPFRGALHSDGAATSVAPCPSFVSVSCRSLRLLKARAEISNSAPFWSVARAMAMPHDRHTVRAMIERGEADAHAWADAAVPKLQVA